MKDVQIEVIKITEYKDISLLYEIPQEAPCAMKVGQIFISKNAEKPDDFCLEAWKTIEPFVKDLAIGKGNFYGKWMKDPMSACISCNDGFRPVSFLLKAIY